MKIQWNKVTWYSKVAAILVGVAIFAFGIYIGVIYQRGINALEWVEQLRIDRPVPIRQMVVRSEEGQYEYTKEGIIKNNATGDVEVDDWVLIYEKPGAPAQTIGIVFMTSSRCAIGVRVEICNPTIFKEGQRVRVMGHMDATGKIIIERLEVL